MLITTRITVVGLGLMGGSLALALRGKCARVVGVDVDPRAVGLARERGAVDLATTEPAEGLSGADLVVLAVPVRASLALLEKLPAVARAPLAVMDLGSTKRDVVRTMAALPAGFDPIGGHPMCGREQSGMGQADARLFENAPFALTPLSRTSQDLRGLAEELVTAIGARPLFVDPDRHDRAVAAVSHLPYLTSVALVHSAETEGDPGVWELAGPGFRDSTRLAASDLTMMLDILGTNRDSALRQVASFQSALAALAALIGSGDERALSSLLAAGRERRLALFQPNAMDTPHVSNLWPGA